MTLQRAVIEEFLGVDRNAVESAVPNPQALRNLHFDRTGGLVAFGGRKTDFSSETLGGDLIAYDESTFALYSDLRLWLNANAVLDLDVPPFDSAPLTLVPRAGVVARFTRRVGGGYEGGAYVRLPSGAFTAGVPVTGMTVTQTGAGSGIPAGTYRFIYTIEAPTDSGLATIFVGEHSATFAGASTSMEVKLNEVLPLGWVVRWFVRRNEVDYDGWAATVSNGTDQVSARKDQMSAFVPTSTALVNFAPGRAEVHLHRTWGKASRRPFTGFYADATTVTVGGHMVRSAATLLTRFMHQASIVSAKLPMVATNDEVVINLDRLTVQRVTTRQPIVVDLFGVRHTGTDRWLTGELRWEPTSPHPVLRLSFTLSATGARHVLADIPITSGLSLGTALNAILDVDGYTIVARLGAVTQEVGTGRINSGGSATIWSPESATFSAVHAAIVPLAQRWRPDLEQGIIYQQRVAATTSSWVDLGILTDGSTSTFAIMERAVQPAPGSVQRPAIFRYRIGATLPPGSYVRQVEVKAAALSGNGIALRWEGPNGTGGTLREAATAIDGAFTVNAVVERIYVEVSRDGSQRVDVQVFRLAPFGSLATSWADWGTFTTTAASTFTLGTMPLAFAEGVNAGARRMEVSRIRALRGATVLADGSILDYVSGTTWTSGGAGGEPWTVASAAFMEAVTRAFVPGDDLVFPQPDVVLVYSDTGAINRGGIDNYLTLSPTASTGITALASTPAGLLVFMENETFVVRGNPDQGNEEVQRLSGTLGNDVGTNPARLGSVVFPIYRGEVYAVNLGGGDIDFSGGIENVSRPIWREDDPVVQVVGETQRNHVVALTRLGRVYRYDARAKAWFNDPFDQTADLRHLIPANLDQAYGTRYVVGDEVHTVDYNLVAPVSATWEHVDLGDRFQEKLWRRVEVATNVDYVGPPRLIYEVRRQEGLLSSPIFTEGDFDDPVNPPPALALEDDTRFVGTELNDVLLGVNLGEGRWGFSFRRGQVGATASLRVEFPNFTKRDVFEAPLTIETAPRNRPRGRVG